MRRVPLLALFVFSCAKNGDEGMVVVANTAPTGTTCVLTGQLTQPGLSAGQIYANSPNPYVLTPLVESRITAAGSGVHADRSVYLQNAEVTLTTPNGSGSLTLAQFSTPISGAIPPEGLINLTFPIIPVDILHRFGSGSAQVEVIADVTIYGLLGGGMVKSDPFSYGVTICPDAQPCVIDVVGGCSGLMATVSPGNPCNPFQDGVTDCCTVGTGSGSGSGSASGSASVELVCPAVAM